MSRGFYIDQKALLAVVTKANDATRAIAEEILDDAKIHAPVDTGRLRESGYVEESNGRVRVGFTAPYAGYQEFGTRYMAGKFFLTNAALRRRR